MCSGLSFLPATTRRFSTASAPGSSRKKAMSAKLSSTLAGMALLQCLFLLRVLGPRFGERLAARLALEDAAPTLDERDSHGLEQNAIGRGLDNGFGAVFDVKLL